MLSFENTKTAFENQSDKELRKTFYVFKLISIGWLNAIGTRSLKLALFLKLPVKGIIKTTVFNHFCGGESIIDCERRIQELASFKVGTILDYSVEGEQDASAFNRCHRELLQGIERAKKDQNIPFCVAKLTGLIPFSLLEKKSSKKEFDQKEQEIYLEGIKRVNDIAEAAFNANIPFMIDAEESWIQDAIDEIALDLMKKYNSTKAIIYNTAQLYRHDRLAYMKDLLVLAKEENFFVGIKIVRGAYMEKERERAQEMNYPSPIQKDKISTDKDYDASIELCIINHSKIALCCGTHNEASSLLLCELMESNQLEKGHPSIYFAQLLGMSDHISFNLSKSGYNVAKYVPYGPVKDVMPYLIRRADENTSISGQTGRELGLIMKEIERRKVH